MCFLDNEPTSFSHMEWRRARAEHRCDECFRTIARGEHYEFTSMVFEGRWLTVANCRDCASLRRAVTDYERARGCFGIEATPPSGEVWRAADERELVSLIARAA